MTITSVGCPARPEGDRVRPGSAWEKAVADCETALARPDLHAIHEALLNLAGGMLDCVGIVHRVTEAPHGQDEVRALAAALARAGYHDGTGALERYLIVRACQHSLKAVPTLSVSDHVKELILQAFVDLSTPTETLLPLVRTGDYPFVAFCKLASLRRFPAGQFDWEVTGLARSYFVKASLRSCIPLLRFVATRLGGRSPVFMPHFSLFRRRWLVLLEAQVSRSYYQMALALERQPSVRGMVAAAWFYSPDTYRVSPHLSWLRSQIVENGGFAAKLGAAKPDSGVLRLGVRRRELYEKGEFRPTEGLVVWGRDEMIQWAGRHPEYAA